VNDDELKAVAKAADFKAIKEIAIKDPGFAGRFKAVKSVGIDKLTIGAFIVEEYRKQFGG
jgi:hypothetical protein